MTTTYQDVAQAIRDGVDAAVVEAMIADDKAALTDEQMGRLRDELSQRENPIVVGDWVVAGKDGSDGLDWGCIVSLDGDKAEIGWQSLQRSTIDLTDDDVEVYGSKAKAEARYHERAGS